MDFVDIFYKYDKFVLVNKSCLTFIIDGKKEVMEKMIDAELQRVYEIIMKAECCEDIFGIKEGEAEDVACGGRADLNCDKRVNLVDFSIAAYWYKRTISAEFAVKEKERLNGDGKVDLVDFSIMAFYWTG